MSMSGRTKERFAKAKRAKRGANKATNPKAKGWPRLKRKAMADFDPIYEATIDREHELRRKTHTNSPAKPVSLPYISIQHIDIPRD